MIVIVLEEMTLAGIDLQPGQRIDIPEEYFDNLKDKVRPAEQKQTRPKRRSDPWRPEPKAWLKDGELRTTGVLEDLASEIVKLTEHDLELQKRLLLEHCQMYDQEHFWVLKEQFEERAAILEHEQGFLRAEAELEAARRYKLLAFLDELGVELTIH